MRKVICVSVTAAVLAAVMGCDSSVTGPLPADLDKLITAAQGIGAGTVTADPIQHQDRLQDGSGVNCPDPTGQRSQGTSGQGTGHGGGEQLRLRDGTCAS
jgi:hypothetical protein